MRNDMREKKKKSVFDFEMELTAFIVLGGVLLRSLSCESCLVGKKSVKQKMSEVEFRYC